MELFQLSRSEMVSIAKTIPYLNIYKYSISAEHKVPRDHLRVVIGRVPCYATLYVNIGTRPGHSSN